MDDPWIFPSFFTSRDRMRKIRNILSQLLIYIMGFSDIILLLDQSFNFLTNGRKKQQTQRPKPDFLRIHPHRRNDLSSDHPRRDTVADQGGDRREFQTFLFLNHKYRFHIFSPSYIVLSQDYVL